MYRQSTYCQKPLHDQSTPCQNPIIYDQSIHHNPLYHRHSHVSSVNLLSEAPAWSDNPMSEYHHNPMYDALQIYHPWDFTLTDAFRQSPLLYLWGFWCHLSLCQNPYCHPWGITLIGTWCICSTYGDSDAICPCVRLPMVIPGASHW